MRKLLAMAVTATLGGCVETMSASPQAIWVKQPLFSLQSPDGVAERHCARFGRQATLQGEFGGGESYFVPIRAYDCR